MGEVGHPLASSVSSAFNEGMLVKSGREFSTVADGVYLGWVLEDQVEAHLVKILCFANCDALTAHHIRPQVPP